MLLTHMHVYPLTNVLGHEFSEGEMFIRGGQQLPCADPGGGGAGVRPPLNRQKKKKKKGKRKREGKKRREKEKKAMGVCFSFVFCLKM